MPYLQTCGDISCRECEEQHVDWDTYYDADAAHENGESFGFVLDYSESRRPNHLREEEPRGRSLRSYSFTPSPLTFHGRGGPFYGVEIEVTTDRVGDALTAVSAHDADESLIYCKADGSVAGLELVTHPMSYAWAMREFPWRLLPELKRVADATVIDSDNGIHVHVSRDGFSNPLHVYRWMKLWYRNPRDIQRIARRRSDHWAPFNPDHREAQKIHCKYGTDQYYDDTHFRGVVDPTRYDRYAAINTTNENTLEVRVFASSLRPSRVKAALQLVASTVEYTRGLTAEAVCKRQGWDWDPYMNWVEGSGRYPELVSENSRRASVY